jgi:subtilisin family serine protease
MRIIFSVICMLLMLPADAQNVGIGATVPVEKLHVAGNIKADTLKPAALKIATGAADGKVLTSDATGNAVWRNVPVAGSSRCFIPIAVNSNTLGRLGFDLVTPTQQDSVDFGTPKYNTGGDFTITTAGTTNNRIILNSDGLYHFEGFVIFNVASTATNQSFFGTLYLATKESLGNTLLDVTGREMINQNDFTSPFGYTKGIKFTMDRFYAAGTEITLVTAFNNLSGLTGLNVNSGYLSLYKIAD